MVVQGKAVGPHSVKCMTLFVLHVAQKLKYHFSPVVTGQSTAGSAIPKKEADTNR